MEGLSTAAAKTRLMEILKSFKDKNKKQPVRNARFYATKIWTFEVFVYFYGLFLVLQHFLLKAGIEPLVTGATLLVLPLRYVYYKANKSKFQWEIFDERIDRIIELVKDLQEGEDMADVNLRTMNFAVVDVCRDGKWIKLPAVVLVKGDLVSISSGIALPAPVYIVDGHFADRILEAYETLPQMENNGFLESKAHGVIKESPSKLILESLLHDRALKKKKTPTFFMVSLKQSRKIFLYFFLVLLSLNLVFSGVWSSKSSIDFSEILLNPTFLFLFLTAVILPSLVHLLNCWGNALLWCICESLRNNQSPRKSTRVQHLESLFDNSEHPGNIWSAPLAEKAESAFENEEMVSFFPPVSIFQCFSKCRSFLIGGLQRDLNILDLMSSSTVMSFIDKDGVISENSRYADEVIVMGPEGKILPFDLVHQSPQEVKSNNCEHDQMTFIGKVWEEHINSLKPLGLATSVSRNPRKNDTYHSLINLNDDHPKLVNTGELFFVQPKDEIEIFEECACIIGKIIGFTNEAIDEYHHWCTLWSTWRPNECESLHDISYRRIKKGIANKEYALCDYIEKRISQARRISAIQQRLLRPCHLLTSIVEKDGKFEVFSQGNPKIVLQNCRNYWEGGDLQVLEDDVLQQLNTALLQWTADDYDAIGFSYRPLSDEIEKIIKDKESLVDLDDFKKDLLQGVQREHIFLGMVAITNHPKSEANHFIEDVFDAGIRFVIFSEGDLLETKAFGDDLGLYTAWNSCISLSDKPAVIEEFLNQDGKKVLPNGIEEIKNRLVYGNDNVPLLVSMFSDSTKSSILEMVKIYQQNGEVPIVIGGSHHSQNAFIYQAADISIGVKTLNCGYCKSCFGYRINYKHTPLIQEQVAESLISLPCTFILNIEHPLYVILQIIKESRKLMKNIQNGLMFSANMFVCWSLLSCILLIFGLPPAVSLLQCLFICVFLVPLLSLSFLSTPCEQNLMKKYPIKVDIYLEVFQKSNFFWYFSLKVLMFVMIVIQTHIWGLSFLFKDFSFFNINPSDNRIVVVQISNFLCAVLLICIYSSSYVNSFQSWLQVKSLNNMPWIAVILVSLLLAVLICVLYLIVYGFFQEFNDFLIRAWYVYLVTFIEFFVLFWALEAVNYASRRLARGMQKTLEVYFQTKLGVYSPR
jgi:hypothetical protein